MVNYMYISLLLANLGADEAALEKGLLHLRVNSGNLMIFFITLLGDHGMLEDFIQTLVYFKIKWDRGHEAQKSFKILFTRAPHTNNFN